MPSTMIGIKFFNRRYVQLLKEEPGLITRARIKILTISVLSFMAVYALLLLLYLVEERNMLLVRISLLLASLIFTFIALMKWPWRVAAHLYMGIVSFVIWSNILLFYNGLNAVTVQYTILVLSSSYYLLGAKWGAVYSALNILPIICIAIVENYTAVQISLQHLHINNHAYSLVIIANYLLLMYTHYFFFKTYRRVHKQETAFKANLQKSVITAQELATTKTNFLSTMSHELRTPLNAVVGMTNILMMQNPSKEQEENLKILKFSAESLMSTVNDILDFSKIEQGNLQLENSPFKPIELLANIYGSFKTQAADKNIALRYVSDQGLQNLAILGDETRLAQILFNLLGNAIKFTSAGHVTLAVKISELTNQKATLHFTIEDTGIGIPQERLNTIFDPFVQVSARSDKRFRGTGLGLTIVLKLVQMHGAELHLTSTQGKGTTFSFSLTYPLAQISPTNPITTSKEPINLSSLKVLVAEDELVNVMVIKKILGNWGIVPTVSLNGAEALEAVRTKHFDVVLMDINMPIMDGFEAAKRIREIPAPEKSNIPIIAVTASIGAIDQSNTNPHIDDYLLKPFKVEQLKEKLEQLAQRLNQLHGS